MRSVSDGARVKVHWCALLGATTGRHSPTTTASRAAATACHLKGFTGAPRVWPTLPACPGSQAAA
jgi:hypothetical protein